MRRSQLELALDAAQASLAAAIPGLPYGFLRLETWSPGDGWTRYRLHDERGYIGPYMRRSVMLDTLATLTALGYRIASVEHQDKAHRPS